MNKLCLANSIQSEMCGMGNVTVTMNENIKFGINLNKTSWFSRRYKINANKISSNYFTRSSHFTDITAMFISVPKYTLWIYYVLFKY